jgi:hypothetical protein
MIARYSYTGSPKFTECSCGEPTHPVHPVEDGEVT